MCRGADIIKEVVLVYVMNNDLNSLAVLVMNLNSLDIFTEAVATYIFGRNSTFKLFIQFLHR